MQKETEIKLRVSRETLAALREHPLLKKRNKSGWERRELMNQYFDTPERDLAQAKVALRLRKDGDDIIQTLKTRGQSVAGLSERNEYNWGLPKAKLDVKKLDGECWPEQLAELNKKTLKPIFTTDFVRERAEIAWGRGKAKVVIEAARRGEDIGSLTTLEQYQRWRRFDTVAMGVVTDGLNRLFSNDSTPLRLMRDLGLGVVERLPGLKRMFIR